MQLTMKKIPMMRPQIRRYRHAAVHIISEQRYILIDDPDVQEKLPILTNASKPERKRKLEIVLFT
jgi:hypothetical protein